MADPITGLMVMAGVAEGGKALMQYQGGNERMKTLDMERMQQRIQHQQKTLANFDLTEKILGQQLAEESIRGVNLSSPSFTAIQRSTLNTSAKREENENLEYSIMDSNIKKEKENVRSTLWAQLFGDVAEASSSLFSMSKSLPTKG